MAGFYLVKKNDVEFKCDSKAVAYEMYDCLKRVDVIIEHHVIEEDLNGNMVEWVHVADKMKRRTLKSGEHKYYLHIVDSYKKGNVTWQ